jgi:hypothetical protein
MRRHACRRIQVRGQTILQGGAGEEVGCAEPLVDDFLSVSSSVVSSSNVFKRA